MPDRLIANSVDAYLTPWAAVNRLKSVFPYVEADGEAGRRYVLETLERLKAARSLRKADRDLVQWLDRVKNRALFVCFGDAGSDSALLSTYVIPGMPLAFDYASVAHERQVHYSLARCAAALGYEIRKDRRILNQPGYEGLERRHSARERRRIIERRIVKDRRTADHSR